MFGTVIVYNGQAYVFEERSYDEAVREFLSNWCSGVRPAIGFQVLPVVAIQDPEKGTTRRTGRDGDGGLRR